MRKLVCVFALCASVVAAAGAAEWQPAKGPLVTRWAKDVSPTNAHPEYPRPQMVRKEWLNLNGLWDYAIRPKADGPPKGYDGKILVPFPVESALSGVMKRVSRDQRLWYRRTIETPKGWDGRVVLLHFEAVDWEATVYLDGKEVGVHRGGYDAFTVPIATKGGAKHELVVGVFDPTNDGHQPRGKQVKRPGGIMYTPTTGIWQTVWLEPVPRWRIEGLRLTPDLDGKRLILETDTRFVSKSNAVHAVVLEGDKEIARGRGLGRMEIVIPKPRLWSPDDPFLYGLKIQLTHFKNQQDVQDEVTSYFGMRKVSLVKDEKGVLRLGLNGKPVFHIGPLDQGFWPDGLYTAPTDEALRYDVEMTRKLGMNCARKHVKIEPARWYYWCDRLGLMVWQDMPSGNNKTPEARKQFETELTALIKGRWNHPSIVMWVPFNEGWGQHDTERYSALIKKLDPTRLVNNTSGWTDKGVGDVHDVHAYPGPRCPKPEAKRAAVLGEFGGLGLGVDGHTWAKKTWGYRGMASREELTRRYVKLLQRVYELKVNAGLAAAIYTQTSDVETECNGLMTYDREMVKPDLEQVAKANRFDFPPPPIVKVVVPTSQQQAQTWRYTLEKPAAGWEKPGFDDKGWKQGPGGFGRKDTPGAVARTEWTGSDIWLRRECTVGELGPGDLALMLHHDEDAEVYINGVLASKTTAFTVDYEEFPVTKEGKAALKPGKALIAVHCKQTGGGQYIDVGIVRLVPRNAPKR